MPGLRMALTRSENAAEEWTSVVVSAGAEDGIPGATFASSRPRHVSDFLLRDTGNPSSVLSSIETARSNARMVRTALTRETWESINEAWMALKRMLGGPIDERDLPKVLDAIKRETALIRGAFHGTMLRNEIFDFSQLGTFVERADNTARILDVKYYVLLPSISWVGSSLDNYQWESILRSVVGAPLLSLGLRGGLPADQHRRLPDPQRAHAALARLLLPQHRRKACASSARHMASATLATRRSTGRSPSSRSGRSRTSSTPACTSSSTASSSTTIGWATRSPRISGSTEMRLKITHRTEYRYDRPIAYALQRVRLLPRSGATQKVGSWSVTIEGAREEVRFTDHFGNETRLISVEGEPRVIGIEATGEVETYDKAGVIGLHRGFAPLWLFMRETELTDARRRRDGAGSRGRRGRRYRPAA